MDAGCPRWISHSDGSGVPIDFNCDSAETRGLRVFSSQEAGSYVTYIQLLKEATTRSIYATIRTRNS